MLHRRYSLYSLNDTTATRIDAETCNCESQEGTLENPHIFRVFCMWGIDDPIRLFSITLSILSIVGSINSIGVAGVINQDDGQNEDFGIEKDGVVDEPVESDVSQGGMGVGKMAKHKGLILKLIGFPNVFFGISVSIYFIYTMALQNSLLMLCF